MPLKEQEIFLSVPALFKLIAKLIKFSKGGLDKAEREELALDLVNLGLSVGKEAVD